MTERREGEKAKKEWNIAGLPETETPIRTLTEKVDESDDEHENDHRKEGNESMLITNVEIRIIIGFEEGDEIVKWEGGGETGRESLMKYCRFATD